MEWLQMFLTILGSVLASSGFWAFVENRKKRKDGTMEMIRGLAHDRIVFLGMSYVRRGWLTQDEYNNLHDYLYVPYKNIGGNGTAKRVMDEVSKLEIRDTLGLIIDEIEEERGRKGAEIFNKAMVQSGYNPSH